MAGLSFCLEDRTHWFIRRSLVFAVLLAALSGSAAGAINAWTNATSSYWEYQTNWSLGIIPDATQSVYITNAGFKAVAIGANTAQNFPQSMQIQDLQIASAVDSFNELLMNFSGFTVPLQTTSLSIGSNSAVVLQSSMLEAGNIVLGSNLNEGDFSQVKVHGQLQIRHLKQFASDEVPPAAYFLTNGTLSVDTTEFMGGFPGPGQFVQYGGVHNVGSLGVDVDGEFDIYDGQFTATNGITVGFGDFAGYAFFYQYGGTVNADTIVNGHYILNGGTRTGSFSVTASGQRADGSVVQTGGTNSAPSMDLGHPNQFGGGAFYTLSNGVVRVDSSTTFRRGRFSQYSGLHTIASNFVMQGTESLGGNIYAEYHLEGGTLSVGAMTEQPGARFNQDGGTNSIAGALVIGPAEYDQSTSYALGGGTLMVKDISINHATFFQHTGGNIIHSGLLTLSQGEWRAAAAAQSLGPLQLNVGTSNNSAITFPGGSSILRLAKSSAQPWDSGAILYVTNWHGSASGGGGTQLYFGSDATGLTSQQLAQIKFSLSGAIYPARILATGEVVPDKLLTFSRSGNTLTLTWGPGWTLQSSTNVTGPYQDVQTAASPYALSMTNPIAFFCLRQQ